MINVKQKNAPKSAQNIPVFKIFKEMKSLYCRGLLALINQYTTPKDIKKAIPFKLHPAHV